jgi:hypothetical protein
MKKPYCTPKIRLFTTLEKDVLTLSTDPTVADMLWNDFSDSTKRF